MSTCIATVARNENRYIEEFFAYYHDVLGCERIYFYDDSDDGIQESICGHYRDYVVHVPWRARGQVAAFNHALHNARCDFLGFFDIDEFLALKQHDCIDDYVRDAFASDTSIVHLNWRIFSSMGHEWSPPGLVTSSYTKCLPARHDGFDLGFEHWRPHAITKYLVRRSDCTWAETHAARVTGNSRRANENADYSVVQLNHYQAKSVESVIERDLQGYDYTATERSLSIGNSKRGRPFWRLQALKAVQAEALVEDLDMLRHREKIEAGIRVGYTDAYEHDDARQVPDVSGYGLSESEARIFRACMSRRRVHALEPGR